MDTVAVTGANSITAQWLLPKLREQGYYVLGLIRKAQEIDADEVIPDWVNSEAARKAMREADIIVHLSGDINGKNEAFYRSANVETTKIVAEAAKKGMAQRVIFLSYPHADVRHKNWHLKYKAEAEQILLESCQDAVIFRPPAIIDSPANPEQTTQAYLSKNGEAVQTLGDGKRKMRPVYRGDVVNAILAALKGGKPGVYDLSGAEEMTVDEFIQLINRNPNVKISHTPPWLAKILSYFIDDLSPTFVDIILNYTNSGDSTATYREFGVKPTSLREIWQK